MKFFPLFLSLKNKRCLIVGGGKVAERKIRNIIELSPDITVVAPNVVSGIKRLSRSGSLVWEKRTFEKKDLKGVFLVFAATDDERLNTEIADLCDKKNIPVNVAKPGLSGSFIVPSFMREKDLVVAVSTMGQSPLVAALLNKEIKKLIKRYKSLLDILKPWRASLLTEGRSSKYNKILWRVFLNHPVLDWAEKGDFSMIEALAQKTFLLSGEKKE